MSGGAGTILKGTRGLLELPHTACAKYSTDALRAANDTSVGDDNDAER